MIITKNISLKRLLNWSGHHIVWLTIFMGSIALLYKQGYININIPWLPISIIGTAVAFYVGFKNNQSYDRLWEARKIWGGIVNESRTWGMMIDGFVSNLNTDTNLPEEEINQIKKKLIYRHIAWLYSHRSQLLVTTNWEHSGQKGISGKWASKLVRNFGIGMVDDDFTRSELKTFLPSDEHDRLIKYNNTSTQIINEQSRDLAELKKRKIIDDFRHMELTKVLRTLYALQGKNERIKKFPFPRQYANMSRYFVGIFILLFPFSMIPELMTITSWGIWLAIPISVLIGWIYVMMEVVGDYSENPFQGMANDIPMLSLCRIIEIDLRQMLNEKNLPPNIEPKNGVLL
ncbi:MAG: bestrophin family protein [Flavobacteriaceae bacterium]